MRMSIHRTAFALALASCSDDGPQAPEFVTSVVAGECALTFSGPPSVPPPPLFTQQDAGSCAFGDLGELRYAGTLEINTVMGTQVGTRTFTAADGSSFRATSEGKSTPRGQGLVDFTAALRVVGGTGRFADASGELQGRGTANQVTRATTVTFTGTLTLRTAAAARR
jgi:hypothetical protein